MTLKTTLSILQPQSIFLSSPHHTANDMQLIPMEKSFFFIEKCRTTDLDGLNIREETYYLSPAFIFSSL